MVTQQCHNFLLPTYFSKNFRNSMSKSSATDLTLDFYNSNTNLVKQYRKEKHLLYGTLLFGNIFSKYRRKKGPFLLFSDNYTHSI